MLEFCFFFEDDLSKKFFDQALAFTSGFFWKTVGDLDLFQQEKILLLSGKDFGRWATLISTHLLDESCPGCGGQAALSGSARREDQRQEPGQSAWLNIAPSQTSTPEYRECYCWAA